MSEWLSVDEAAKYLGVSSSNLYSLSQQGRVPGNKLGKMWRFNRRDLDAWMRAQKPIEEFFLRVSVQAEHPDRSNVNAQIGAR